MNDMERREFEEGFKKAFENTEVQPGDGVWNNVELDLIKTEGEKMKKRVFFYQMLAAASVTFALLVVGAGLYVLNDRTVEQIALQGGQVPNSNEINTNKGQETTDANTSPVTSEDVSEASKNNAQTGNETAFSAEASAKRENNNSGQAANENLAATIDRNEQGNVRQKGDRARPKRTVENSAESASTDANGVNPVEDTQSDPIPVSSDQPNSMASGAVSNTDNAAYALEMPATHDGASHASRARDAKKLPALYEDNIKVPAFKNPAEPSAADPVALMFQRLKDIEDQMASEHSSRKKKNTDSKEKLWTSLAFAAGSFNSVTPSSSTPMIANSAMQNYNLNNARVMNEQAKASGVSYSLGLSMGTSLTNRLVIQGGINYLTEVSDFTSTQAIQSDQGNYKAVSLNTFRSENAAMDETERYIPTAPYTVNNSNEYLSIPVQAGYLIIKRRLVWQMNAGVSTDLFLQNTVDAQGDIERSKEGAGADSPYRTVNFSGLVGSEISYRFGGHYRLGLNPGFRYPFNSIYKEDVGIQSTPLTFDVGLRFRYIFH
jgi:hypothetical protein